MAESKAAPCGAVGTLDHDKPAATAPVREAKDICVIEGGIDLYLYIRKLGYQSNIYRWLLLVEKFQKLCGLPLGDSTCFVLLQRSNRHQRAKLLNNWLW